MEQSGLLGRESEFADLERAVFGSGVGVVLGGERGVGKTALWDGLLLRASDRLVVSRVIATEAAQSIPFGVLASSLGQLPASPLNTAQLLNIALNAFAELAGGDTLVLGVDDVHLLDDASATLIDQLVRSSAVILIATHASEDPLPEWLRKLAQQDRVRLHDVRPLERSGLAALASTVLGGAIDESVEAELWRLSNGNPLIARQLIASALESGVLVERGSAWTAAGRLVVTGHLGELLDLRLAERDPDELALLEVAATGGLVELDLLEAIGGHVMVEALEEAELLRVDSDDGRVATRLQHPLLSERIDQSMPLTRRRRISRTLAEWVASTGARRVGDALRVATWDLASGVTTRPDIAVRAARQALAGADPGLAERLCRAVVAADGGFEAQLTLGQALFEQGRSAQAEEALQRAQESASSDGESARAGIARCQVLALGRADLSAAVDVATGLATTISDPDSVDELTVELARLALAAGDPTQAIKLGQQIAARETASTRAVVSSLIVSAPAQVMVGRFGGALDDARRGLALIDDGAEAPLLARERLLVATSEALLYNGQLAEATSVARSGYRSALEGDLSAMAGMWQAVQGRVALWAGDVVESRALHDQSIAALTGRDPLGLLPRVQASSAIAAAHAGELGGVERALARIDPDFVEANYGIELLVERANAWIAALQGDTEAAAAYTRKAALAAIGDHHFAVAAAALHDAVRFGHPGMVFDKLVELEGRSESTLLRTFAKHAVALAAVDGAALDAVSDTFAEIGANLLAAEAATQAAAIHGRTNGDRAARRSHARADALLSRCPGALTPAIAHREALLTTRQNQIARLAGNHTNAEIATQLSISVRTVENHLAAIFHTLNIHSRAELLAIFGMAPDQDRSPRSRPGPKHD